MLEGPLPPKLHQLIWALAGDQDKNGGTGWVCCDTLAALLSRWFQRAHQDKRAPESLPFTSEIIENAINLKPGGKLLRCLSGGGVACLTTGKNADHYTLLIGTEGDYFLGFDSWWDKKTSKRVDAFAPYKGMVNIKWSRGELEDELQRCNWVHLLGRS